MMKTAWRRGRRSGYDLGYLDINYAGSDTIGIPTAVERFSFFKNYIQALLPLELSWLWEAGQAIKAHPGLRPVLGLIYEFTYHNF